jgi:hypothetical protein
MLILEQNQLGILSAALKNAERRRLCADDCRHHAAGGGHRVYQKVDAVHAATDVTTV